MRWRKILIAAALLVVVLVVAAYAFLSFYDLNKFKPMIAQAVKEATGRELTIAGDIDIGLSIPPTLLVEDVTFQNAHWSSRPNLAQVKRMEIQIALLPLILGDFDFIRIVLIEPDLIVEFNSSGISNFAFDTSAGEEEEETALPVLIFSHVHIEKGLFSYKDAESGLTFAVRLDRLDGGIPGFDKSLKLNFEGAFDDIPLTLEGTLGPIIAWIEPGHTLPANLTAGAAGASVNVKGEIRDPINFKDLAFTVTGEGSSIAEIAKLVGVTDMPELGAFELDAKVADPEGKLALEGFDLLVGSEELAEISLNGTIKDLLALGGINLNFTVRGKDAAKLTEFGLPPPLVRGAFSASGRIFDPRVGVYSVSDLRIALGENEVGGRLDLNLTAKPQYLTAKLTSQKFALGPYNLEAKVTGPTDKLALEKLDLRIGTEDLALIRLNGAIKDLLKLDGVNLNFRVRGKDLANLGKLSGLPLPVRGAFSASGQVIVPAHNNFKIPNLKITVGKNHIAGSLDLNRRGQRPRLSAVLSSRKFDLASLLTPEIAKIDWVKALANLKTFKLSAKLAGFAEEITVEDVDFQAGTQKLAEVTLKGSIKDLSAQRGINLNFAVRGKNVANLEKFIGRPLPIEGAFAVSGQVADAAPKVYKVSDLKVVLGENNLAGWVDLNLADQRTQLAMELSTQRFNLRPVSIPAIEPLTRMPDWGPFKLSVKLAGSGDKFTVENLDLNLGSEELVELMLKGTIKDLLAQQGVKLEFAVRGKNLANLKEMGGPALPFQGPFSFSGQFVDPAPGIYKIPSLKVVMGDSDSSGWVELNLAKQRPKVTAALSSQKMDLRPLLVKVEEKDTAKDTPAKPDKKKDKVFSSEPWSLDALNLIDADIKIRDKQVLLPRVALDDMTVDILLKNGNLTIEPIRFMIGGGSANGRLNLCSQDKPSSLAMEMKIEQLDLGPMLDKLGYQQTLEGTLNADITLAGSGNSLADLMAGLNGGISVVMMDGQVATKYLNLLQNILGTDVLRLVNPFKKKETQTKVNCFINDINVKDGLAECKLLLDTDQTSIFGVGDVDLRTEKLDLVIKPVPKKGYGLDSVAKVSFSFKELSQPFELGGTLAHPSLALDPTRTLFILGKMAGAVALGPFGIAAFFADVSLGKKDPCLEALKALEKEDKESNGFFRKLFRRGQ